MVIFWLRPLLIIALVLLVIYFVYRKSKLVIKRDKQNQKLKEAIENIEITLKEAEKLPKINKNSLNKAIENINEIINQGKKIK